MQPPSARVAICSTRIAWRQTELSTWRLRRTARCAGAYHTNRRKPLTSFMKGLEGCTATRRRRRSVFVTNSLWPTSCMQLGEFTATRRRRRFEQLLPNSYCTNSLCRCRCSRGGKYARYVTWKFAFKPNGYLYIYIYIYIYNSLLFKSESWDPIILYNFHRDETTDAGQTIFFLTVTIMIQRSCVLSV